MLGNFVESVRTENQRVAAAASPTGETPPQGVSPVPDLSPDDDAAALAAVAKLEQEQEEKELADALAEIERTESGEALRDSLNSSGASRDSFASAASIEEEEDEEAAMARAMEEIQRMEESTASQRAGSAEPAAAAGAAVDGGMAVGEMDTQQLMDALELATDAEKQRLFEVREPA